MFILLVLLLVLSPSDSFMETDFYSQCQLDETCFDYLLELVDAETAPSCEAEFEESDRCEEKKTDYDLRIPTPSLVSLGTTTGWEMKFRDQTLSEKIFKQSGIYMAFLGIFNVGKTFIASMIGEADLSSGFLNETEGICILFPLSQKYVLIDTKGILRSIPSENLHDKLATDTFVRDVSIAVSDIIIFVVNTLSCDDQNRFDELHALVDSQSSVQKPKKLLLIHNFREFLHVEEVQEYIERDIIQAFGATEKVTPLLDGQTATFWDSGLRERSVRVNHLVLANEMSPAGVKYNKLTIKLIREKYALGIASPLDVPHQIAKHATQILPDYFYEKAPANELAKIYAGGYLGRFQRLKDGFSQLMEWLFGGPQNPFLTVAKNNRIGLEVERPLIYYSQPFNPHIDVLKSKEDWIFFMEAPGMKTVCKAKEDQSVNSKSTCDIVFSINNGVLDVTGKRRVPDYYIVPASANGENSQTKNLYDIPLREQSFGYFRRQLVIPSQIDAFKINEENFELKHGLLTFKAKFNEDNRVIEPSFSGLVGGLGGSEFDHSPYSHNPITVLKIGTKTNGWGSEKYIWSLSVVYGKTEVREGSGFSEHVINLADDEVITGVKFGYADWVLGSLQIVTNKRLSNIFGNTEITMTEIKAPLGQHLSYLTGRAGDALDALQFHWTSVG